MTDFGGSRRIWAVWQPHTYSRTMTLFEGFCESFEIADRVVVLDVFPARENKPDDFNISDLVAAIRHKSVQHIPEIDQVVEYRKEHEIEMSASIRSVYQITGQSSCTD